MATGRVTRLGAQAGPTAPVGRVSQLGVVAGPGTSAFGRVTQLGVVTGDPAVVVSPRGRVSRLGVVTSSPLPVRWSWNVARGSALVQAPLVLVVNDSATGFDIVD